MLFKSYLKSSKKHISFCVNKSQNHTNRFGKASHFVLAIVHPVGSTGNLAVPVSELLTFLFVITIYCRRKRS